MIMAVMVGHRRIRVLVKLFGGRRLVDWLMDCIDFLSLAGGRTLLQFLLGP